MSEITKEQAGEGEEKLLEGVDEARLFAEKIACLEKERDDYLDGWKRAKADLVNYRRDEEARLREVARFGTSELVRDLVAVLDSFDLARAAMSDATTPMAKGVFLIQSQLEEVLKRHGLERIVAAPGEPFDPSLHESVGELEADVPEHAVVREVERGYRMNGKVVRPARVIIAKKREEESKE